MRCRCKCRCRFRCRCRRRCRCDVDVDVGDVGDVKRYRGGVRDVDDVCDVDEVDVDDVKEISCQWGPQSDWGPQAMQLRYHDATSDNLPGGSSRYFEFRAIYTSSERKPRTLHMHAWLLATVRLVRSLLLYYPLTSL